MPRSPIAASARSAAAPIVMTSPAGSESPKPGRWGAATGRSSRDRGELPLPHPSVDRPGVEQEEAVGHEVPVGAGSPGTGADGVNTPALVCAST